jgi:hypothetical protein
MTWIMNTGRYENDVGILLVSGGPNQDLNTNIHTGYDPMIGWLIGNIIWWVGLIVIIIWAVQKCAI